jgi:hypothetical protein
MKSLIRDYLLAVSWYVTLLAAGLVITLTLSSAVGYLPYSDRPGPGWVGPSFSLDQLGFYASWGVLLLIPTALYGSALFAYHRFLRFVDAPVIVIRGIGALTGGIIAFVLVAGAGWYIAIAAFPVWAAAALGAFWGGVLLPRYLGTVGPTRSPGIRWSAITLALVVGPLAIYGTFFAPRYGQDLSLSVVRVRQGPVGPGGSPEPQLEPQERALLDSLFPHARVERGMTGSSSA